MNVTSNWRIVSSPDFDDDYLRMEVEPYVELHQHRDRVSGTYHVGLQQGEIDGRIEGTDRIVFSFEGMDEMEEVHGRGTADRRCAGTLCPGVSPGRQVHLHVRAVYVTDQS